MRWRQVWHDWQGVAVALGLCAGASVLNARAWHVGYRADAIALLGCHFLRALLLLFAWLTVVEVFRAAVRAEGAAAATGFTWLHLVALGLTVPACVGCYPVWGVVLPVLAALLLAVI